MFDVVGQIAWLESQALSIDAKAHIVWLQAEIYGGSNWL